MGNLNSNQVGKLVALQAEYASRIDASRQSVRQAERAVDSTMAQLRAAESSLKIRRQILKDIQPLQRDGAMARSQYLKEYQEFLMLEGDVKSKRSELKRIKSALAEARQNILKPQPLPRIDISPKVKEGQKHLADLEHPIRQTMIPHK